METYHQQASQASNARPFNNAQMGAPASDTTTQHSGFQVQDGTRGAAVVLPALGSLITRSALARLRGNDKHLTICYFAFVLALRLFLKSNAAAMLPAVIVMILEDSLSIVSFSLGLLYLHNSDGIARMLLRKRSTEAPPSPVASASMSPTSLSEAAPQPGRARPEDVKLFLFAM